MYKGQYTAQITLDFHIDAEMFGLRPVEELKRNVLEKITPVLRELLNEDFLDPELATVTVTQLSAHLDEETDE